MHSSCCIDTTAVTFLLVLLSLLLSPGVTATKWSCEGDTLLHVLWPSFCWRFGQQHSSTKSDPVIYGASIWAWINHAQRQCDFPDKATHTRKRWVQANVLGARGWWAIRGSCVGRQPWFYMGSAADFQWRFFLKSHSLLVFGSSPNLPSSSSPILLPHVSYLEGSWQRLPLICACIWQNIYLDWSN